MRIKAGVSYMFDGVSQTREIGIVTEASDIDIEGGTSLVRVGIMD